MHNTGMSYVAIVENFRRRGAKTAQGKAWDCYRLRRAVRKELGKAAEGSGSTLEKDAVPQNAMAALCQFPKVQTLD